MLFYSLSNRKLPEIHIPPTDDRPASAASTSPVQPAIIAFDATTRTRLQQLNAASDAIDLSVEQRLQQHTADQQRLAAEQRRIQHQSFIGQQLLGAGRPGTQAVRRDAKPTDTKMTDDARTNENE